ncbi:hypothetical protein MesoLjLc_09630 [Mesorhizobium sp. L-8-10]|nr:hypothetical protein MesoLjLc_09630 [Mesorhizobium sp. L-8-10]
MHQPGRKPAVVGRLLAHVLTAAAATAAAAPDGIACGYEDPRSVSIGILNWVYPDALHVMSAVWQAEHAGVLPPRSASAASGPLAFYRAASSMEKLGARLEYRIATEAGPDIAVVLLPAAMWTRHVRRPDGINVKTHVPGPEKDDVVVVTSEKVVRALLAGDLTLEDAQAHGLMRFYGKDEALAAARATFRTTFPAAVLSPQDAVPADHAGAIGQEYP